MATLSDVDHSVPETTCPLCGHKLDHASGMDTDDKPTPGDASVCISCASPLIFDDDLAMRPMTAEEWADLHPENKIQLEMAMRAIRQLDRRDMK